MASTPLVLTNQDIDEIWGDCYVGDKELRAEMKTLDEAVNLMWDEISYYVDCENPHIKLYDCTNESKVRKQIRKVLAPFYAKGTPKVSELRG